MARERDAHKHFQKPKQEVRNYFVALKLLEEKLKAKELFSKKLLLEVQAMVEEGASKEKIVPRGEMPPDELVEYVNTIDDHPIIIAAVVHYQLLTIHSFEDGNGRTARLISGYILDFYGYGFKGIGMDWRE